MPGVGNTAPGSLNFMRILWHVRFYPPGSNTGADWYAHELNKFFVSRGHEVRVMMGKEAKPYNLDGVEILPEPYDYWNHIRWADVIFTQLDFTSKTLQMVQIPKSVFWIMHNTFGYSSVRRESHKAIVVYNSYAAMKQISYPNRNLVLQPPVNPERFKNVSCGNSSTGKITLINLSKKKGADLFYKLAEMMPDVQFLGVKGSPHYYSEQVIKNLPNVEIMEHTPDITKVYEKTRILLMPSPYESWGRTATEAAICGIPVICTPTFGLMENMGDAGIYCKEDNITEWIKAMKKLTGKKEYDEASAKVKKRAAKICDPAKLLNFEEQIMKIAGKQPKKQEYATA